VTRKVRLAHGPNWLGGPSRLARLESRLAVDQDGCVFAGHQGEGSGTALAWPLDYAARIGLDGVVEIVDGAGDLILREGECPAPNFSVHLDCRDP